jgi:hypothetical protein
VEDLVTLLLAAREAFVDRALQHPLVHLQLLGLLLDERHEIDRVHFFDAELLTTGVERRLEEVGVVHPGNLDGY